MAQAGPALPLPLAQSQAIEQACLATFNRYLINADHHVDRFTEVFTPDVVWTRPGGAMHGHAEMQAFMDDIWRQRFADNPHGHVTRHMLTTHLVTAESATRASGIFYALVWRAEDYAGTLPLAMRAPELVVEYRSRFALHNGRWLIDRHEAQHVFSCYAG